MISVGLALPGPTLAQSTSHRRAAGQAAAVRAAATPAAVSTPSVPPTGAAVGSGRTVGTAASGTLMGMSILPDSGQTETVSVTGGMSGGNGVTNTTPGGGLMPVERAPRSQSGMTRDYIAKQAPTTSIDNLVASLPGVVSAKIDPLGMFPNDTMTMRGLTQSQIGFLFEGAPEADPLSYVTFSPTLVDNENIGSVTVSQGSPDLDGPLLNAVGGQISTFEINPSHRMGGYVDVMGGTHSGNKEFARFETGDIGNSGVRGFVSFSYTSANNWRGPGDQFRYHVDSKFVKEWGQGNSIRFILGFNRQSINAMLNPTLQQWRQMGDHYNLDATYTPGDVNYYKFSQVNSNVVNIVAPMQFTLTKELQLNLTPYYVHEYGPQVGGENIPVSGGYFGAATYGTPGSQYGALTQPYATNGYLTALLNDPWNQKNSGLNSTLRWTHGNNTLTFGWWYSYAAHTERYQYDLVNYAGNPVTGYGLNPVRLSNGQILSGDNLNFWQQVNALYVSDNIKLLHDKLQIGGGFKAAMMYRSGTNNLPGASPWKATGSYFEPLPQFYASYQIDRHDQVFINGTTAFRAPVSVEAYTPDYDPNSGQIAKAGSLKPEYSIGEEIGYRHTGFYNFSISLFNLNLTNHNISSSGYIPGSTSPVAEPINAGGETSRGVQAEFGLGYWHHFSPYLSGQYLHSTMDNNFDAGADILPTKGKISVGSPKFTGAIGLQYDNGTVFGNFNLRYVDSQYTTFMNDESIPSYTTSDLTLGYRFRSIGPARHPQIQLNLINIGDVHYLAAAGSTTGNAHTMVGMHGAVVAGSAPIYLTGAPFAAFVSMSSAF
ncbi:TonB-dependent receptor plug domain-containing protein [Gluconacetobacter tumulisoli]|uniref:TonB-dependent receptor plug domain-containing protein n=2 Tax=Gluconacetobacter tumulisoli TaxID=1286189 RepID=A0A7W4K5E6_9PROT|nr:TonB-dependent receptor plug domain-containing protein [Gluconacetobacter tumulisoli]